MAGLGAIVGQCILIAGEMAMGGLGSGEAEIHGVEQALRGKRVERERSVARR
jgi:hypothetical protein